MPDRDAGSQAAKPSATQRDPRRRKTHYDRDTLCMCDAAGDNLRNTKIQISYFAKIRRANRNKEFRLSYFAARRNRLKIECLIFHTFNEHHPPSV